MDLQRLFGGCYVGKSVLVTGDTGFKGSWMCLWLRALGAQVVGFSTDSAPPDEERNFRLCGMGRRIAHVTGDVRDLDAMMETIRRTAPEIVFHLAAQPLVSVAYEDPKRTFDVNCGGTVNLFEAVRKTESVRAVVVVTTDKVYKDQRWVYPYREIDPLGGHDPYSASKAEVELKVESYRRSFRERGFARRPVAIATARGGNVVGGGDFARDRLVPDSMRALLRGRPIQVRNPRSIRPWQHVLDLLSGYLWLGAKLLGAESKAFCQAWNFGPTAAKDVTTATVVRKIVELWGGGRCEFATLADDAFHETFILKLDPSKTAHYLAWHAARDWEETLRATVEWFQEYRRQRSADGPADLHACCLAQIGAYASKARALEIAWAAD